MEKYEGIGENKHFHWKIQVKTKALALNRIKKNDGKQIEEYSTTATKESTLRGEWQSGLNSFSQVTEVEVGRVRSNSGWVTSEACSQLTSPSFGRDVKLGVPCLDAACTVGLS